MAQVLPVTPVPLPPALEYLRTLNQLIVIQALEVIEVLTGFETKNKYVVMTPQHQQIFFMAEESSFMARLCCSANRGFTMHVFDNYGQSIMQFERPCFLCFADSITVYSPPNNLCGRVERVCPVCTPSFNVYNAAGVLVLKIKGKCCACKWCEVRFDVLSLDGVIVGGIFKEFGDLVRELFDYSTFIVTFPVDLDIRMKATMLGACMLLDYLFFEEND